MTTKNSVKFMVKGING